MTSPCPPHEPPGFETHFAAAMQLAADGRFEAAADAFAALIRVAPQHAPSRQMLAAALRGSGRLDEALRQLEAAAALAPRDANVPSMRSEILLALGRRDDALAAAQAALALDAGHVFARMNSGLANLALEHWSDAAAAFAAVLDARPQWIAARCALVRSLLLGGDPARASGEAVHPALMHDRDAFRALLGDFAAAGALPQRIELLEAWQRNHPHDYEVALALAETSHRAGRLGDALRWSEAALALRPQAGLPREILATALVDRGDVEHGLAIYRQLLPRGDAATAARHLVLMHYDPAQDNARLFAAHSDFARRHLRPFGPPFAESARDPAKKLRVGWLSPRLGSGPVATFLHGLLAGFDRDRHRHLLIGLLPPGDAAERHLHHLADESIDASGLDDARLLQRLRGLDLDVLVDLAGHSTGNRLNVLAQRVAPVQICWLDWFDTTAVPAMDAWLSDEWLTPADSTQRYSEKLVRLAAGRLCYTPPEDSPAPVRDGGGPPVFASFSRLAKINDTVVETWAEILHRSPDAQLEIRAHALADTDTRAHLRERFARRGIDAGRLRLHGELDYRDLLAAYSHVDIALDPFPFSGCTTTCDALWMGCPTISAAGETFVSRQSASLLCRLGRNDWVARDRADYVERALALARAVESVRAGRADLREAVRARLCNAQAQAADFAAVLRDLWSGPAPERTEPDKPRARGTAQTTIAPTGPIT